MPARGSTVLALPPQTAFLEVAVTLQHFTVTTYAVEPAALAKHLPEGFAPEVFELREGARAFVSAVTFLDRGFRLRVCPWPAFDFGQTNYRAYVLHEGKRVGWFFATSLDSAFVTVPRIVWQMPWHGVQMKFDVAYDANDRLVRHRLVTTGALGGAELDFEDTFEPTATLPGFPNAEETALVLTHPMDGYFRRRHDGATGHYGIWHAPLVMTRCKVHHARFTLYEELGLIAPNAEPHSVLFQPATDYLVFLPPRRLPSR